MKYNISKQSDELEIKVGGIKGKEKQLVDAFQKCQEGSCLCPTQEYQKLDSLQIEQTDGEIKLRLRPKEGTQFNQAEIERCLEHTSGRLKSEK